MTTATSGARTISVEEAGRRLGISRSAAYRCANNGQLPTLPLGRRLVVPVEAFDRMLAGEGVPPALSYPARRAQGGVRGG